MTKSAMMGVVGLIALLLTGCSAVPSDPRAVLEEKAATVDSAVQDLFEALNAAGLPGATAGGVVDACQSEPAPGVSYRAGMGVHVGDEPAAGFKSLADQLAATGWQRTDDDLGGDENAPMARFSRGDITLDVKTGGVTYAGERQDEDRMTLGVTIKDHCVRVPNGGYITEVKDLAKDILPRH